MIPGVVTSRHSETFASLCGLKKDCRSGFKHDAVQKKIILFHVNEKIGKEERCSRIMTETYLNHEKSEVKVVFIRNGFHTTLLHKTRINSPSIWNHVKTEKGNNIQNN